MLVLSRKNNEQIVFPELGIVVKVIRVKGNQVRLGISAPQSVRIKRGELDDMQDVDTARSLLPHLEYGQSQESLAVI